MSEFNPGRCDLPRLCLALLLGGLLVWPTACAPAPTPHVVVPPPADATASPEKLASAVFDLLSQERAAIAQRDPKGAAAVRAELLKLADADLMRSEFAKQPGFKPLLGDDAAAGYVKMWSAQMGYYLDGIALADARHAPGGEPRRVTLLIPARGAERSAVLRMLCVQNDAGLWHALELDFEPPGRVVSASTTGRAGPTTAEAAQP